jgi:hypothetical protein
MPIGSVVVVKYDGIDITSDILWSTATFEVQQGAVPGPFQFTVVDRNHNHSFITGKELTMDIDAVPHFGGYVVQVERAYPFPAMDTYNVSPNDVPRYFTIHGLDYNLLFDKRVLRRPASYLTQIPNFSMASTSGALIRQMCADYLDIPAGFDTTTYVDDLTPPFKEASPTGAWQQQGTPFRKQMEDFTQFTAAVWYFDAEKKLHHHAIESAVKRWGFSDHPNKQAITASPLTYQGATIGMREVNAVQKGDHKVHDVLIWGGSQWAGPGGTVFKRETATPATGTISYQLAETHFGEFGYGTQAGVDERANIIVNGSPGAVEGDQQRGLKYDQWNFRMAWYAHLVPKLAGVPDHVRPGYLAQITLETFADGPPLSMLLPLRQVKVSFPELDPTGKGYVRFDGLFGLQPDDPYTLWKFLLDYRYRQPPTAVMITTSESESTAYGAYGSFTPTPAPNGAATIFSIPFGYIANTTMVYLFQAGVPGGTLLRRGVDYTESDPQLGRITLVLPPPPGDELHVECRMLAS